jgi:hypothetical protein
MIQSRHTYWAVCDYCQDEGPESNSEANALRQAMEVGWTWKSAKYGNRLHICIRCQIKGHGEHMPPATGTA